MIHLHTTAGTAVTPPASGPDAATGDFLALLASLVADTTDALADDTTTVSPWSGEDTAADDLAAEGATADDVPATDAGDDLPATPFAWPTGHVLAALLAQPAATELATDATPAVAAPDASTDESAVAPVSPRSDGDTVAAETERTATGDLPADGQRVTDRPGVTTGATAGAMTASAAGAAAPAGATTPAADGVGLPTDATEAPTSSLASDVAATAPRPAGDRRTVAGLDAAATVDPVGDTAPVGEARMPGEVRERGTAAAPGSAISRVLDALELLEAAPPPRQITLDLGDLRVRVALDEGQVRLQVLGDQRDADRDFLRSAEEALRERGFDLTGGQGERPRDGHEPGAADLPAVPRAATPGTRPTQTSGARPGLHL